MQRRWMTLERKGPTRFRISTKVLVNDITGKLGFSTPSETSWRGKWGAEYLGFLPTDQPVCPLRTGVTNESGPWRVIASDRSALKKKQPGLFAGTPPPP